MYFVSAHIQSIYKQKFRCENRVHIDGHSAQRRDGRFFLARHCERLRIAAVAGQLHRAGQTADVIDESDHYCEARRRCANGSWRCWRPKDHLIGGIGIYFTLNVAHT